MSKPKRPLKLPAPPTLADLLRAEAQRAFERQLTRDSLKAMQDMLTVLTKGLRRSK